MSGLLSIAYSGLNSFQRALYVTGNNIANQRTLGYSRQTIQLATNPSQRLGGSYIGNGVKVGSISRNANEFVNNQVRSTLTVKSQYENFYNQAAQIDKLLTQDGSSISASMHTFFDSLGQLNDDPASPIKRNVVLSQSQLLASKFNSVQIKLDEYQRNSTQQLNEAVTQINQITSAIASLNEQIVANPSDLSLLDNRDEMLKQLSSFSEVIVMQQDDNSVSVALAGGDMLVSGTTQRNLMVGSPALNSVGTKIFVSNGNGGQMDVTNRLSGGMLGGLMDYEHDVLGQSSQLIGQIAIGLAQTFNAQHQLGMDMNNSIGTNFFTDYNSPALQKNRALSVPSNAGTAVLSVSISDISQTQLSDYSFIVSDASNNEVRVIRNSDGVATTATLTSNPPAPPSGQLVIDGMTINVDDTSKLVNTDTFTLLPTRGAAKDFALEINDSKQIAFASCVATQASLSNTGLGKINLGSVLNTNAVTKQYSINFISETEFILENVTDGISTGPHSFTPNTNNSVPIPDASNPSYSIILSGLPQAGDQFSSEYNVGGIGDNRNGLNLFGVQQTKMLLGGTNSLFDGYASLLNEVGSQVNQANTRYESASVLHQSALDFKGSQNGVDLDEEAANLLQLQQAYEAAGKLMKISSEIMDVLFQIMR